MSRAEPDEDSPPEAWRDWVLCHEDLGSRSVAVDVRVLIRLVSALAEAREHARRVLDAWDGDGGAHLST